MATTLETLNSPDFPLEPRQGGWWVTLENREPTEEELNKLGLSGSVELEHVGHGSFDWICWDTDGEPYRFVDRDWEEG